MADGKIQNASVIDYLSYTTKIYQLCQRFEQSSVWFYDREYRHLQAQHGFRWGTDVPHIHQVHLIPKPYNRGTNSRSQDKKSSANSTGSGLKSRYPVAEPVTANGQTICKLYNSRSGCDFSDCHYRHVCSVPRCGAAHIIFEHQSTNG
jgi:hypothetical protein